MDSELYRKKVYGAWVGKAVGGTLGQPWEGCRGPLALTFYQPVPTEMMPNDDLDLQVLWAVKLANDWNGVVHRSKFAECWLGNIEFPFDEYGVAIRNLRLGIPAPWSGSYDNFFVDGMGAAIRSELWACLAPNDPEKAARLAEEDACLDHAGDGLYAIRYLAALESMAFNATIADIPKLIIKALDYIPADSELAQAISLTVKFTAEDKDNIFERIDQAFGSDNFTDVKNDLAIIVAALCLGGGDFGHSICTATNLGRDTDCTAATVGAILGIINPDSISKEWRAPIGDDIVLSKEITGIVAPKTLSELTDLVVSLRERVSLDLTTTAEPDWSRYQIKGRKSVFTPWFADDYNRFTPMPSVETEEIVFPGNLVKVDFSDLPPNSLLMLDFDFTITQAQDVRLLVNTPANLRVWVDGKYCFGRESGSMVPAFHRPPLNQFCNLNLTAGQHCLTIGLAPAHSSERCERIKSLSVAARAKLSLENNHMQSAPMLFGFADSKHQWLPELFRQNLVSK